MNSNKKTIYTLLQEESPDSEKSSDYKVVKVEKCEIREDYLNAIDGSLELAEEKKPNIYKTAYEYAFGERGQPVRSNR